MPSCYSRICDYLNNTQLDTNISEIDSIAKSWDDAEKKVQESANAILEVIKVTDRKSNLDIDSHITMMETSILIIINLNDKVVLKKQNIAPKTICGLPKKQFQARCANIGGFIVFLALIAGNIGGTLQNSSQYGTSAVTWVTVSCVVAYIVLARIGDYYNAKWASEGSYEGKLRSLEGRASAIPIVKSLILTYRYYTGGIFAFLQSLAKLNKDSQSTAPLTRVVSEDESKGIGTPYAGTPFGPGAQSLEDSFVGQGSESTVFVGAQFDPRLINPRQMRTPVNVMDGMTPLRESNSPILEDNSSLV